VKTGLGGASDAYNITEYVWVEDTLTVTPTVYSDGSVGLATSIKIGSRSKPEGVVQRSIITERSIEIAENRVRPGESLIIGGMRKTEKRSVVRGVPFFKDLPLIGYLFSSKDFEEKGTEIFFILTPSISSGGKPFEVATEDIRRKFEKPTLESAQEWNLLEPFEEGSYRQVIEKRAAELETRRVKAEAQREEALQRLQEEKRHFQTAVEEARKLRQEAMTLQEQAAKAQQEAQQAIEAAAAAEQQQKAQQEQTTDLSEAVQKALDEARLKQAQLQQAQQRAAEAEEKARQEEEAVRQIQGELKQFEQQEKESPPPGPETAPSPSLDN
jgi:flagellar biosynthesis GTPase FlhF